MAECEVLDEAKGAEAKAASMTTVFGGRNLEI